MIFGILPTLSRDFILSKITQEQIFEHYLGIKVETGYLVKSPPIIRTDDSNPSFSFYYSNNGKLRARDFAGYFWGDCFDIVAHILHLNTNDKKSFAIVMDKIARDFRLHKYAGKDVITTGDTYDVREVLKTRNKADIQFKERNWDKNIDGKFWLSGNINRKILELGRVFPCAYVWLNNNLKYTYNPNDPAYAYYFTDKDIKIYFPNRKEYRFLSNTSYIQGIDLLEKADFGIITKSYKDVLSLKSFGITSIAPSSETVVISKENWEIATKFCPTWFSLMDFDRTGILLSCKLRRRYNTIPLFFANYKPLQKLVNKRGLYTGKILGNNYPYYNNVKDFYDCVKINGVKKTEEIIMKFKDKYNLNTNELMKQNYAL